MHTPRPCERLPSCRTRWLYILLAVLGVTGTWFGICYHRHQRQQAAIERIGELGGFAYGIPAELPAPIDQLATRIGVRLPSEVDGVVLIESATTDEDLRPLNAFPRLKRLSLAGTPVTNAGLQFLSALTRLEHLNLSHTQVTEAGVNDLRERLPNCQIVH